MLFLSLLQKKGLGPFLQIARPMDEAWALGFPQRIWGSQDLPAFSCTVLRVHVSCLGQPWSPCPASLAPAAWTIHLFSDVSSPQLPLWASKQSEAFLVSRPSVTLTV